MADYDVIVVGGRPSGSTLAARLGVAGLRVLLIERAAMPSLPSASSPIIYAPTMAMLDEIGADEAAYARNTPKIRRMVSVSEGLHGEFKIPTGFGRDYAYAIDRERFDHALFETAKSKALVTALDRTSLIDLVIEHGRVVGIVAKLPGGERQIITAEIVVGADGRYSTVAQKVNAATYDTRSEYPTSIYYAYWRGVEALDDKGPAAFAYGPGFGYGFLIMDSADDTTVIAVEGQSTLIDPPAGQADLFYEALIKRHPRLAALIQTAERVTPVRGMKRVGNLYRAPGGAGWALVGDAYHQKDPIDGQGIFDAVYTAKLLAESIIAYKRGEITWAAAMKRYDDAARAETYPMYISTMERVRTSLYTKTPAWGKVVARWMLQDTVMQEKMGLMLTRQIRADQAATVPLMLGAIMRGPLRDLSQFLERQLDNDRI